MDRIPEYLDKYPITGVVVGLAVTLAIGVVAYFFARMLLSGVTHATSIRPPLITAMSLLGILGTIALIGALFTTQESAYTIAATVVGGLTGYLTAQAQQNRLQNRREDGRDDDADVPSEWAHPWSDTEGPGGEDDGPGGEDDGPGGEDDMDDEDTSGFPDDDQDDDDAPRA